MATAPQRFSEFLVFLESALTEEMKGIMPLVIKRYNACSRPFKNSKDMLTLLTTTKQNMEKDQRHMFIYLKDFLSELAAYQEKEKLAALKRKRDSDQSEEEGHSSTDEGQKPHGKKCKINPIPDLPAGSESVSNVSNSSASAPIKHNGWIGGGKGGAHVSLVSSTGRDGDKTGLGGVCTPHKVKDEMYISLSSSDDEETSSVKNDRSKDDADKILHNGETSSTTKSTCQMEISLDCDPLPSITSPSNTKLPVKQRRQLTKRVTVEKTVPEAKTLTHNSTNSEHTNEKKASESEPEPSGSRPEKKDISQKHIRKLEKLLGKLRNEIEKVREKELSLDDLDAADSSYIYEDRLEKKFVAAWNKLCEAKKRKSSTGRPIERRFTYQGSRYPEINKRIERLVNKKKMFPDYFDIRKIFKKVNEEKSLQLSSGAVDSLSRDTFTEVGNILQQRRHEDFVCTFRNKQTESFRIDKDPALFDKELKRKLDENRQTAKNNLAEVINKYADLQYNIPDKVEEESTEGDVSLESADEAVKLDLEGLSDGEISEEETTFTENYTDEIQPRAEANEETKTCLTVSDTEAQIEKEDGLMSNHSFSDHMKLKQVSDKKTLSVSNDEATIEKDDVIKPDQLSDEDTKICLSISDDEARIEKEDVVKPNQVSDKPTKTCLSISIHKAKMEQDGLSRNIRAKQVTDRETETYVSISDDEVDIIVEKSNLIRVIPDDAYSAESYDQQIQPRSSDPKIWPTPKQVTPIKKPFNESKSERKVGGIGLEKLNCVDEHTPETDCISTDVQVVDEEHADTDAELEVSSTNIPSSRKVLDLHTADSDKDIEVKPAGNSETSQPNHNNTNHIDTVNEPIVVNSETSTNSKTSDNEDGEKLTNVVLSADPIGGGDYNFKTETLEHSSLKREKLDENTFHKETVVEIIDDDDDDDITEKPGSSPKISEVGTVSAIKQLDKVKEQTRITVNNHARANKTLLNKIATACVSDRSSAKSDIANNHRAHMTDEKPVSCTAVSTNSFVNVSASLLSSSTMVDKRQIQIQVPVSLLKKNSQRENRKTVHVNSLFQNSGVGGKQDLNNTLVSTETSIDSTEVNEVSSSNIPLDDNGDDDDVIMLSSGNFENDDGDDDDVIILSD